MEHQEIVAAMRCALRAGEVMLESSVAVSEVAETLRRITRALGLADCEVSVTLDTITLCWIGSGTATPITVVRRVESAEPHLDRLAAVDTLSRRIEAGEVGVLRADAELAAIAQRPPSYPGWVVLAGALLTVAGWCIFAGGGPLAALAGALSALAVTGLQRGVRGVRVPVVFVTAASAVLAVAVPYGFVWAGVDLAAQAAVAGALYPLLPGGLAVASVMDGLSGAPLSSLAKGLQAVIQATFVAIGVLVALSVADALEIAPAVASERWPLYVSVPAAGVALAGLAVSRLAPVRTVAPTALLGMGIWALAAWGPENLELGRDLTTFGAATVLGLGGQALGRALRTTPSIFTSIAVYVLVPGVVLYLAMSAIAQGATELGVELLEQALRIAVAIAAGVALGVGIGSAMAAPVQAASRLRGGGLRGGDPPPDGSR